MSALHKNLVAGVLEVLEQTFGMKIYADKVIERLLKTNRNWGSRDRAFVAEHSYNMVRHWRLLWALKGEEPALKRKLLWELFGVYWLWKGQTLPDWEAFATISKSRFEEVDNWSLDVLQSYPEWLHQRASQELAGQWPQLAKELNNPAPLVLRTNLLKTTRAELIQRLQAEGLQPKAFELNNEGLVLEERSNTFKLESFKDGWFEVQDGGSQLIAPFVEAAPGMRIIDACAGAGGKSLHLAALMENKGSILSMDIEAWKLEELKKRARRNGVHNLETRPIESTKTIKRLEKSADRVLLDVPCSGTGVIKRNPDTKWKLDAEHLDHVVQVQSDILERYSQMVKPGGKLVYATCSIFPSENEDQVTHFLDNHPDFKLENQQRISPSNKGTDGFFMARLIRYE